MSEDNYNKMYDQLVSSDDDISGLLAYCLYKRHKRDFIIKYKNEHGNPPSDKEMEGFMTSAFAQIKRYKTEGEDVFVKSVGIAVQRKLEEGHEYKKIFSTITKTAQEKISKIEELYKTDIEEIVTRHTHGCWKTIWLNLAATVIFSSFLGLGYFLLHTSETRTNDAMDHIMRSSDKEQIVSSSDSTNVVSVRD